MDQWNDRSRDGDDLAADFAGKAVSRRHFLKLAGIGGAAVGMGAGLATLSACGGSATTTTTAAATTSSAGATSTTAATPTTTGASTVVTTGAEGGRDIKIGMVSPQTGPSAAFGVPDGYSIKRWEEVAKDGLALGDGKTHKFQFLLRDTQGDSNRAAQVAGDLINNDKVDMLVVASAPDTVLPTVEQAEANSVPCLCYVCPMETFFTGRQLDPNKEYQWGYNFFWLNADLCQVYLDMYQQVPSNNILGYMFPNDADGQGDKAVQPPIYEAAGIKTVDGGAYQPGTENYGDSISKFKAAGCELLIGDMVPPDFVTFWKQCIQQSFQPKAAGFMKGILFPEAVEAAGDIALNTITECWWHPTWPYKSSLTGETCQQLATDFETTQNRQWTQPVGGYCLGEWAIDVLKRATDPDDKGTIVAAIKKTKLDTVSGLIDFTAPLDANGLHPFPNGVRSPLVGTQWIKGSETGSKYKYDEVIVGNPTPWAPGITATHKIQPMQYS
jgi:branched-chain amino acid transport system substrate-binding protein